MGSPKTVALLAILFLCVYPYSSCAQSEDHQTSSGGGDGGKTVADGHYTKEFRYLEPGVLFPDTALGGATRYAKRFVAVPNLVYPLDLDPRDAADPHDDGKGPAKVEDSWDDEPNAVQNSVLFGFGGANGPEGTNHSDPRNFQHPDRDTFGELRSNYNPFVSSGQGH